MPFCLFTDPELARVGLSESEAKNRGIAYRLAKIPVTAVLRSLTLSETRGFYKALVAADSDRILGFTAFAPAGRRGHGGGPSRDRRGTPLHGPARHHLDAPHDGGGARRALPGGAGVAVKPDPRASAGTAVSLAVTFGNSSSRTSTWRSRPSR